MRYGDQWANSGDESDPARVEQAVPGRAESTVKPAVPVYDLDIKPDPGGGSVGHPNELRTEARPNELHGQSSAAASLANILESGEQIMWSGRPVFSRYLLAGPWYLIPFTIMWCGFAIFWEISVLRTGDAFFELWGIPFVLIGLYMVFGRYFVLAREARSAIYAITDRRVLILGGAFRVRVTEIRLASLPPVLVNQDLSGVGDITFGVPTRSTAYRRAGWPMASSAGDVPSFFSIERPSEVARIIDQARGKADTSRPRGTTPAL